MKKLFYLFLAMGFLFVACNDDDDDKKKPVPKSSEAEITSFVINGVEGTIEGTNIKVILPDTVKIDSLIPVITLSDSATVSPASGELQDFTSPVTYTVTAEDGETKKTYTATALAVSDGIGSVTQKWSKNSNDAGWELHNHAEPCIAVWNEYLAMVQLNAYGSTEYKIRLFDKNTGDPIEQAVVVTDADENPVAGGPGLTSDDDKSTLISCNLAGVGADFSIWKWTDATAVPEKMLTWTNDIDKSFAEAKGDWADAWVGRKLSVAGDLEGSAFIYATPSFSNTVLRWEVSQGEVVSDVPTKIVISGMANSNWEVLCGVDAQDATANANLIVSGVLCGTMYTDASGSVEWDIARAYGENTTAFMEFNGNQYFGTMQLDAYSGADATDDNVTGAWVDVFNLEATAADPDNYWPESWNEIAVNFSKVLDAEGNLSYQNNVNATADFDFEEEVVEGDVRTMKVYVLGTNCGVACFELSNLAAGSTSKK